jgi:SAM-dependent methyltransferase
VESFEQLKTIVKEKYTEIVVKSNAGDSLAGCGCGAGCGEGSTEFMAEDYSTLEGYVAEADLSLGCGIPTDNAGMKPGDTVLDLGSGAGNDVFIARKIVGEKGRVIGVDMTEAMLARANANLQKTGFKNIEFRYGDIENLPVASRTVDVVLSNCVLNLVPNKPQAFAEIFRVLKPGAHFSISDIVLNGTLPVQIEQAAAMYAGCVAGAMQKEEYLRTFEQAGFAEVEVKKTKPIVLPDELLREYLNEPELAAYKTSGVAIESITVRGVRPYHKEREA